jgi:hypothetical protein
MHGHLRGQFLAERTALFKAADFRREAGTIHSPDEIHEQRLGPADGHAGEQEHDAEWFGAEHFASRRVGSAHLSLIRQGR